MIYLFLISTIVAFFSYSVNCIFLALFCTFFVKKNRIYMLFYLFQKMPKFCKKMSKNCRYDELRFHRRVQLAGLVPPGQRVVAAVDGAVRLQHVGAGRDVDRQQRLCADAGQDGEHGELLPDAASGRVHQVRVRFGRCVPIFVL